MHTLALPSRIALVACIAAAVAVTPRAILAAAPKSEPA